MSQDNQLIRKIQIAVGIVLALFIANNYGFFSGSGTTLPQISSEAQWRELLASNEGVIVADFSATWCGPCKQLKPRLEALNDEQMQGVTIVNIDVDENGGLAQQYNVRSIPTLVFIKGADEVARTVGLRSESDLRDEINRHL